jgi:hypothetical protein
MKWKHAACLSLALGVAGALPLFAIWVPQTREEFVQAVERGEGATKKESFVVGRSLDAVYQDFERNTPSCLDKEVRRTANVGYVEVSSTDYNPSLKRANRGAAAFTLQVVHRPRGVGATPPPGGLYVYAVDLRALDAGRTEVVLYRPTIGYKKITQSLTDWASGENDECPKLR